MQAVFQVLLALVGIFLILLVLVQRGRGGGLAGALGGMGGSSAFGARAGDVFTRITVVVAAVWIVLCIAAAKFATTSAGSRLNTSNSPPASSGPLLPGQENSADATDSDKAKAEDSKSDQESAPAEKPAASQDSDKADAKPTSDSEGSEKSK